MTRSVLLFFSFKFGEKARRARRSRRPGGWLTIRRFDTNRTLVAGSLVPEAGERFDLQAIVVVMRVPFKRSLLAEFGGGGRMRRPVGSAPGIS